MDILDANNQGPHKKEHEGFDEDEYDTLELLERLESLREDMEDLGISSLKEVIQRIEELHRQLDTQS